MLIVVQLQVLDCFVESSNCLFLCLYLVVPVVLLNNATTEDGNILE